VNDRDVLLVLDDCLSGLRLDLLELLKLVLVLFVNVVQVLASYDTLKALVALLSLRVEGRRRVMGNTVDTEGALRIDFLRFKQERVIDDCLADVAFHVGRGFLLLLGIDQLLDDFQSRRVIKLLSNRRDWS